MRAVMIIVVAPCRDYMAGMAQTVEQMLVEAFVAQAAIKALYQAILHGLAGRDVMPFDLPLLLPFVE